MTFFSIDYLSDLHIVGIHILSIDRPYIAGQSGQLRTRVQAFVESLEMKQLRAAQKEDN